ncbi:hypothetical protein FRC05_009228 [Tulasnella sp. 425]|nr:hypothetical protein FRC05_009228 [Tulasnella sp. 425]
MMASGLCHSAIHGSCSKANLYSTPLPDSTQASNMKVTGLDVTPFVCADEASTGGFSYVTGTSPTLSSPNLSSFTPYAPLPIGDILLSDDERVATSFPALDTAPLDAEATLYPFPNTYTLIPSNDQIVKSPLTTWADGFMALGPLASPPVDDNLYPSGEGDPAPWITQAFSNLPRLWAPEDFPEYCVRQGWGVEVVEAGVTPSSLFRTETTNGPSVDFDLSFEWEALFPWSVPHSASVSRPLPDVFPIGGFSYPDAEGLLPLPDLVNASEIPPNSYELEAQEFGAVLTHGDGNSSPICTSPSSDSESTGNGSDQSPPSSLNPDSTPSPTSPILTSTQPVVQSPVIVFDEERASPTPPTEAPKTFKFVFDLNWLGEDVCRCEKKTKKKRRHWKSCPDNTNKPRIPCPYCPTAKNKTFKGGSAMTNLQKHVKTFHQGKVVPCARSRS